MEKLMGIPCLNIFCDSVVIINWEKGNAFLNLPKLSHWCMDTRRLISCFLHLSFSHTYREHNQLADRLSKSALSLAPGSGNFSEVLEGHLVLSDSFQLFWARCRSFALFFYASLCGLLYMEWALLIEALHFLCPRFVWLVGTGYDCMSSWCHGFL